jgi:hypothetical protein
MNTIARRFFLTLSLSLTLSVSPSTYGEMTNQDKEIVLAGIIGPNGVQRMKDIIRGVMGGDPAELNESSKQELQALYKRLAAEDYMSHSEFQEFTNFFAGTFYWHSNRDDAALLGRCLVGV